VIVCAQTKAHAIRPRSQEGIDALSHHESAVALGLTGATQTRAQRQNAGSPSRRARRTRTSRSSSLPGSSVSLPSPQRRQRGGREH
jgi:hypothetical protein